MTGPMAAPGADPAAGLAPGFARLCAVVLLPFSFGYFLSYLLRAVNAALAPDIVRELGLGPSMLGVLTAAYLLPFALFQPILGVLLDRFGPRRVQAAMLCVAALGSALFALGNDAATLTVARALIGLGFSGGLMSSFKAVSLWLPPDRGPLASAMVSAVGGLGVLMATRPADMLSQLLGWRYVFAAFAAITAISAAAILAVVPERRGGAEAASLRRHLGDLGRIFADRTFWRLAPLICTTLGTYIAVQTLWVGGWLRDVAGYGREDAAWLMLLMAVGFSVGTVTMGIVADRLLKRGVSVMATVLGTQAVYFLAQFGLVLQWVPAAPVLWIAFGAMGNVGVLTYPLLSRHFGVALAGRSNTSANLLMFGSAFAIQSLIGVAVEYWAAGEGAAFDPRGYQVAFGALLAAQLLSVLWYWYSGRRGAQS